MEKPEEVTITIYCGLDFYNKTKELFNFINNGKHNNQTKSAEEADRETHAELGRVLEPESKNKQEGEV